MRWVGALAVMLCSTAFAQAQAPAFEVASVKFAGTDLNLWTGLKRSGGRIMWTANRITFLFYAYHVQGFQLSGIEPDNLFYTIDAETNPAASDDQVRQMLQTLLIERFKLAVHRDNKQHALYTLTVGKAGPKVKEVRNQEKRAELPEFLKGKATSATVPEGRIVSFREGGVVWVGRRVTMAQLCQSLGSELRGPVRDQTGLPGDFDIEVRYVPDEPNRAQVDWPDIFGAVQQQLGLKLEKGTGPVEIVVVDHMEKTPTGN